MECNLGCTSEALDNGQDPLTEEESSQNGKRRVKRWTDSEHEMLVRLAESLGEDACWATIAEHIPGRTGKQCRERWVNHIGSNIKKGGWTVEEEKHMARLHATIGPSWTRIANELGGRTENSVKNHYNALLRSKRLDDKKTSVLAQYVRLVRNKLAGGMAAYEQAIELAQNASLEASISDNTSNPSSRSRSSKRGASQQASHGEVKTKAVQGSRPQASGSMGVPSYSSLSVGAGGGTTAMSGHTIGDATAALAAAVAAVQAAAHAVAGVTGVTGASKSLGYRNSVDAPSEGVANSVQFSGGSPRAGAQSSLSASLGTAPSTSMGDDATAMRGKGVSMRRTGRGGRGRPGIGHMPSIRDARDGLMAARARAQGAATNSSGDPPGLVRHLSETHATGGESSHPGLRANLSMAIPGTVQNPVGEVYGATPETASKLSSQLQEQVAQLAGILRAPGMPMCPSSDNNAEHPTGDVRGGPVILAPGASWVSGAGNGQPALGHRMTQEDASNQPDGPQGTNMMQQQANNEAMQQAQDQQAGASAGSLTLGMQDLGHAGYTSVFGVQHPGIADHTVFGRQQGVELGSPMSPGPIQGVNNPLSSMFSALPGRASYDLFHSVHEPQDQPLLGRLSGLSLDVMLASPLSAHTPPASALYFLQGRSGSQYGTGSHISPFTRDSIGMDMSQRNSTAMRAATADELGLTAMRPLSVKTRKGGVSIGGGMYDGGSGLGDDTPASKMMTAGQHSFIPQSMMDGNTPTANMLGEVFLTWTQEPTTPGSVLLNSTMSHGGGQTGYQALTDGQGFPKYMCYPQNGYSNGGGADRCLYSDSELPPVDVPPPEVMGCLDIIFDDDPLEELPMPHPQQHGMQQQDQDQDPGHSLDAAPGNSTSLAMQNQGYGQQHTPGLYGATDGMPGAQELPSWGNSSMPGGTNKRSSTQIWGDAYSPGHSNAKRTASAALGGMGDMHTPTYVPSSLGPGGNGDGGGVGPGGYGSQAPTGQKPNNVAQRRMVTWGPPQDMSARCASEPGVPQYSNESSGTPQHAPMQSVHSSPFQHGRTVGGAYLMDQGSVMRSGHGQGMHGQDGHDMGWAAGPGPVQGVPRTLDQYGPMAARSKLMISSGPSWDDGAGYPTLRMHAP